MAKADLTAQRVRDLLNYDPLTGELTWKKRAGGRAPAGSVAGSLLRGYRRTTIDGDRLFCHRVAWLHFYGVWPIGQLDHINGITDDNRIANLRDVSVSVNQQNRRKARSDSTSGFLGVRAPRHKNSGWVAKIQIATSKEIHLGSFETPELAHAAYLEAKRKYHSGGMI